MNNPWRFFFVGEALLFLLAVWQIINNVPLLILLAIGVFNVYVAVKRRKQTSTKNFQLIVGC